MDINSERIEKIIRVGYPYLKKVDGDISMYDLGRVHMMQDIFRVIGIGSEEWNEELGEWIWRSVEDIIVDSRQ